MSIAKLSTGGALNAMKTEERNDSLDTSIRQAIQKEPLLSFSRTGDSPVQWIQLLHALDQPDLPGWPLLTPLKVTMQKCEKCSREFCSPVNYRRHIRVHRRSLNVNKESHKNRDLLAAFWDKLSVEEAKEVLSLRDASLKEVPSSSVIRALASSLRQPGVWTLPQVYVRAGSALLDIIQANLSRLPISSQELFSILDDASENTFLCAGTAESLQKYVFDEETAKHSLKLTNLIACTTFLFEQQLVKAWVADKDAEALRCQKLLVEEEEAAQKRQAELMERKKQKKLRQKEQKTKDQLNGCKACLNLSINALDESLSAEVPYLPSPSDSNLNSPDMLVNVASCPEPIQFPSEEIGGAEAQFNFSSEHINADNFQTVETRTMNSDGRWHLATNRWQVAKSQNGGRNGFYVSHDLQAVKPEPIQKHTPPKDHGSLLNGSKVWTKKFKADNDDESSKPRLQGNQAERNSCKVMIGSISVTLRDPGELQDTCSAKHATPTLSDISEKLVKSSAIKPCIPVNRHETSGIWLVDKGSEESEGSVFDKARNQTVCSERCMQSCSIDSDDHDGGKHRDMFSDGNAKQGGLPFCSISAKEFLAQRWKEAISANHVKLVLSSELEPPLCSGTEHNCSVAAKTSDLHECTVNGNTEKQLVGLEASSRNAQTERVFN
ncbi:C2H2-like zinc finger protein [Forsythia ovata]|uniref:C2H2-like zinc finger protein n=1 Tax=Forsythia ovata TaxID=205694 RepID=A0ABD1X9J3_9LAMI